MHATSLRSSATTQAGTWAPSVSNQKIELRQLVNTDAAEPLNVLHQLHITVGEKIDHHAFLAEYGLGVSESACLPRDSEQ